MGQEAGTKGTHAALCAIKDFIKEGELFYTQSGDDIFVKEDIQKMIEMKTKIFAVGKQKLPENYWAIKNENGVFDGFRSQTQEELDYGGFMGSGAYIVDRAFFDLPVANTASGETSIPHTLRNSKENYQLKIFTHQFWLTVNNHKELSYAKEFYKKNGPGYDLPHHGAFFVIPFLDKFCLFKRAHNLRYNHAGGGIDLPETQTDCVLRELFEETGIRLEKEKIQLSAIFVQRVPPVVNKQYGFCFVYGPKDPDYFNARYKNEEELKLAMSIDNTETLSIDFFSLDEMIENKSIMLATKRMILGYLRSKEEGLIQEKLSDTQNYKEYII